MQFCPKWSRRIWLLLPQAFQWGKEPFSSCPIAKVRFFMGGLTNMRFNLKWRKSSTLDASSFPTTEEHFCSCSVTFCHVEENKYCLFCYWHSSCETVPTHAEEWVFFTCQIVTPSLSFCSFTEPSNLSTRTRGFCMLAHGTRGPGKWIPLENVCLWVRILPWKF